MIFRLFSLLTGDDHHPESSSDVDLLTSNDESVQCVSNDESSAVVEDDTSKAFALFLSYPGIWFVTLFFVMTSIPFGLYDVALSPYLYDTYGIDGDTAGLYFLSMGALYAVFTQVVGFAVDKGHFPPLKAYFLRAFNTVGLLVYHKTFLFCSQFLLIFHAFLQ